jgi:hypothetical protein
MVFSLVGELTYALTFFLMLYDVVLIFFLPRTSTRCAHNLPWVTKELNGLKNKATKAGKKMKES